MTRQSKEDDQLFGPQGLTEADRGYAGSRYAEVKKAILANPYQEVWRGADASRWPHYRSTLGQVFAGILPGGRQDQLRAAATRTVDSFADLRWGDDGRGFRRIVHPNGVCLFGRWEITEDNPFSGYFAQGRRGLIVSRLSPNGTETRRGMSRSLGLTGKIWSSLDENHPEPLRPANFFTQQDLGGERTEYLNEAVFRNAPNTTALQGLTRAVVLGRLGVIFKAVDKIPDVRQVHEVSELGRAADELSRTPRFLQLQMSPGQPRIEGADLDFRDEAYALLFEPGDPEPRRTLRFDISVSNEGVSRGLPIARKVTITDWRKIGTITYDLAVASYNGDHVIHFHHPLWRDNRNDPSSAIRRDGRRVRE